MRAREVFKRTYRVLEHPATAWGVRKCICRIFTDVSFWSVFGVEMLPRRPVLAGDGPRKRLVGRSRHGWSAVYRM